MTYKAIVWDLDGTLLDTVADLTTAINHAMSVCGFAAHTPDEVRSYFGSGVRHALVCASPANTDAETLERGYKAFCERYAECCNDRTAPYAGILELLADLQAAGVKMAIVSNKEDFAVKKLAERYFGDLVCAAVGARADVRLKPAPDTALTALREMGIAPADALYVGDSEVDIQTAKNSGMPCLSVTYGFRTEEYLREMGGTQFARSVADMREMFGV